MKFGFNDIRSFLGQMIVVPFMFYSGYGMFVNTKNRRGYIDSIPSKRVLTVLLNFDVAVMIFIIADIILGREITLKQGLLSLIAWDSVGNSNWYIFSIIVLYLFTYISAKLFGYSRNALITLSSLVILYSLAMGFIKPSWWYNTTFAYAFGSIYCYYKKQIEDFIKRYYLAILFMSLVSFILIVMLPDARGFRENIRSIIFSFLIVVITMKVAVKNKFLSWSGRNLFPLYIYQRLPMLVLSIVPIGASPLIEDNVSAYMAICFIATVLIAYLHKYINIRL